MSAIPCAFLSETLDQVLGIVDRDLAAMLPAKAALQADAIIAKFKAEVAGTSTLTAAQFRVLTSRCLLYLMRRSI